MLSALGGVAIANPLGRPDAPADQPKSAETNAAPTSTDRPADRKSDSGKSDSGKTDSGKTDSGKTELEEPLGAKS